MTGETSIPPTNPPPASSQPAEAPAEPPSVATLQELGLPIGWNSTAWPGLQRFLVLHVLGILMAGIATSFGAPFWFDLLNRVVNLRATGKPPKTAAESRT